MAQSTGRGRRQAAAFVLGCIRRAARGGVIMGLPLPKEDPDFDAPELDSAPTPSNMEIPDHVAVVGTKE